MRAALVVGYGVNFIQDDRLDVFQDGAALLRSQQKVERLGRGHKNVRRPRQHRPAVGHERVAGTNRGADRRHQQPALARQLDDFTQRDLQILSDVVAQGLEG